MSMFDNAETFLNANAGLFDGLGEEDLQLPERLVFIKGEVVQGTILGFQMINSEKLQGVKVEMKIETGEHAGKLHELLITKPKVKDGKIIASHKKVWVDFLLALFTKEEILAGNPDFNKHVSAKLEFTAGEARHSGERTFQNAGGFKLVTDEVAPF